MNPPLAALAKNRVAVTNRDVEPHQGEAWYRIEEKSCNRQQCHNQSLNIEPYSFGKQKPTYRLKGRYRIKKKLCTNNPDLNL